MEATAHPPATKRRRRRPEEARREILEAAERLLRRHPSHEVTVSMIMGETTLSRKSFYVYFHNRYELIAQLVEPIRVERDAVVDELLGGDSAERATRARSAFVRLASLYARHGPLLRALAEAANRDPDARRAWAEFIEPLVAGHARMIEEEIAAGRITGIDPEPTARALIGMNLYAFFHELPGADRQELEEIADTLLGVWVRALYLGPPSPD